MACALHWPAIIFFNHGIVLDANRARSFVATFAPNDAIITTVILDDNRIGVIHRPAYVDTTAIGPGKITTDETVDER